MTDKQMAEKKREFFEKFVFDHKDGEASYWDWKRAGASCVEVWQWIERLVEEVEKEQEEKITEMQKWLKIYEKEIDNAIN